MQHMHCCHSMSMQSSVSCRGSTQQLCWKVHVSSSPLLLVQELRGGWPRLTFMFQKGHGPGMYRAGFYRTCSQLRFPVLKMQCFNHSFGGLLRAVICNKVSYCLCMQGYIIIFASYLKKILLCNYLFSHYVSVITWQDLNSIHTVVTCRMVSCDYWYNIVTPFYSTVLEGSD